jgi:hypothetical protein
MALHAMAHLPGVIVDLRLAAAILWGRRTRHLV